MNTPILALREHLEGLRDLLVRIPADSYRVTPAKVSGSVGAHVRHCLDHATALLSYSAGGELTYDSRLRGTDVEMDVRAAIGEIKRLHLALSDLDPSCLDQPIVLRSIMQREGGSVFVKTTLGRELAFVTQHTIHHCAIIGLLLEQVGVSVPRLFGYAPSTPVN